MKRELKDGICRLATDPDGSQRVTLVCDDEQGRPCIRFTMYDAKSGIQATITPAYEDKDGVEAEDLRDEAFMNPKAEEAAFKALAKLLSDLTPKEAVNGGGQ